MMNLELLANEVLIDLFEILDVVNLFRAFYGLNYRFDQLIFTKLQRYHLDFRSISKPEFEIVCRQYLPSILTRIVSLRLSDGVETPNLSQFFLSSNRRINEFTQLKSLSIGHTHVSDTLLQITSQCRELPLLTHLSTVINTNEYPVEKARDFINSVWRLPKLTHFYLDMKCTDPIRFVEMSVISQSIICLFTKNISYSSDDLSHLFEHTPNLQRFHMDNTGLIHPLTTISSSLISLDLIPEMFMPAMENRFQCMPTLCYLIIQTDHINLDGYAWENILTEYFPNIKVFRLKMTVKFCLTDRLEDQVNQLLDSFRSNYWIEKHRWFVRCDWYSIDTNNTSLLYTLPYTFDTFYSSDGRQSKSTSPDELTYSSYNHVYTLDHTQSRRNFHEERIISPIRFVNVRHLKIRLPVNDNFWSTIPTLNQLITLDATVHTDLGYSHLQALLDRAPHLYSLSVYYSNNFSMKSFNLRSTSIRRLAFFPDSFLCLTKYFNIAECTILANSSLGSQCEVLLIDVESRTSILDLINSMPKLRALSVRRRYEENDGPVLLETKKEFNKWLEQHSLSKYTYYIIRRLYNFVQIDLWIQRGPVIFHELSATQHTSTSKSRKTVRFCKPS